MLAAPKSRGQIINTNDSTSVEVEVCTWHWYHITNSGSTYWYFSFSLHWRPNWTLSFPLFSLDANRTSVFPQLIFSYVYIDFQFWPQLNFSWAYWSSVWPNCHSFHLFSSPSVQPWLNSSSVCIEPKNNPSYPSVLPRLKLQLLHFSTPVHSLLRFMLNL